MKTGLILEGGAMRGLFSAGVMDVLMENNIVFDGAIGVSAGAAFGWNYKSQQPGRVIRYNTRFAKDPRYASFRSWLKTGNLFGAEFCYRTIPNELDLFDAQIFAQNPMEFYVVCTDLQTGKAVYQKCSQVDETCFEWMRASASMPVFSRVVTIDGRPLLDGGMADSIPLRFFEKIGYDTNVLILTQPDGYQKKPNRLFPLIRLCLRKYPQAAQTMQHRHEQYNQTLAYIKQQESTGKILVIRPDTALSIGRVEHHTDRMLAVYQQGRRVAERRLDEIRSFLSKKG